MITPSLPLIFSLLALVAAAVMALVGWWPGLILVPLALWLLWGHLRQGVVPQAFRAFKSGDLDSARALLVHVLWPGALTPQNRAYFHWLHGVLAVSDLRFEDARQHLLEAAAGAIQTENDRSLIQCLLAEVALNLGDPRAARDHLQLARELQHPAGVDRMIAQLERRLGSVRVVTGGAAGAADPDGANKAKLMVVGDREGKR